jgi:uncharacterized membrane protein YagU involved in acid resistance
MAAIIGRENIMESVSTTIGATAPRAQLPIFWGGLIAGTLDILSAFVISGFQVMRVLHSIASGLLGAGSFKGGMETAVLGLLLHFFIATTATAVYYFASRKLRVLVERAYLWGALYGIAVWLFMNLIVLPLSAIPYQISFPLVRVIIGLMIHIVFIGLPIALIVRRYSK